MKSPAAPLPSSRPLGRESNHRPRNATKAAWIASAVFLAGVWGLVFYHIHTEWVVNVVYSYGWAVPFLALYLGWERWNNRPRPDYPPAAWAVIAIAGLLVVAYLPVRVIQEANPDWVKINWSMMGIAALLTALAAWSIGGLRYVRHFAFPILFCYTALPWPIWFETALVQNLMRVNAEICAEILTIFGMPALAQGNLIQIAQSFVNVEEACSGIRSLQTAFMMGLFLGEFQRFTVGRRVALLALALGSAFLLNMARTLVLAYLSTRDALDRYHDLVGNVGMIGTLVVVWLSSELLRRKRPAAAGVEKQSAPELVRAPFIATFAALAVAALLTAEFLTQRWYASHEEKMPAAQEWNIAWPRAAKNFREFPFHERSLALLKFDSGETVSWTDGTGYRWQAYHLQWKPGRVSKYLAMSHYPTVCLPATGLELYSESGQWDCVVQGIRIPFRTYIFREDGRSDVYVFHAIMEDRPLEENFTFSYYQVNSTERISSVLRGERNLGQRVLGLALRGSFSPTEAREAVEGALSAMIKRGPATREPVATAALSSSRSRAEHD
ncbi:MAG: exosortase/archaeosortase family protein [Verrucomicrobiota bacterium]